MLAWLVGIEYTVSKECVWNDTCFVLQFKENEEKFEKKVQEQLGGAAGAITDTASNAAGKVKEVLPNVKGKHQKHPCCRPVPSSIDTIHLDAPKIRALRRQVIQTFSLQDKSTALPATFSHECLLAACWLCLDMLLVMFAVPQQWVCK